MRTINISIIPQYRHPAYRGVLPRRTSFKIAKMACCRA